MPNFKYFNLDSIEQSVKFKRTLTDLLFTKKLYINRVAKTLGHPPERFYKWSNPDNPYNNFPAYLITEFTKQIDDALLRHIATGAGYGVVRLPCVKWNEKEATKMAIIAMRECAEALETYASAIEDNHVTLRERKDVIKQVSEAIQALLGLKEMVERMNDGQK